MIKNITSLSRMLGCKKRSNAEIAKKINSRTVGKTWVEIVKDVYPIGLSMSSIVGESHTEKREIFFPFEEKDFWDFVSEVENDGLFLEAQERID